MCTGCGERRFCKDRKRRTALILSAVLRCSFILHDWDDDRAIEILKALRQNVKAGTWCALEKAFGGYPALSYSLTPPTSTGLLALVS